IVGGSEQRISARCACGDLSDRCLLQPFRSNSQVMSRPPSGPAGGDSNGAEAWLRDLAQRRDTVGADQVADAGRGDPMAEFEQLASDALVTPKWVLPGQPPGPGAAPARYRQRPPVPVTGAARRGRVLDWFGIPLERRDQSASFGPSGLKSASRPRRWNHATMASWGGFSVP